MTNREYLASLSDDDLADWLCRQIWDTYMTTRDTMENLMRFHQVRNFLKLEFHEGDEKQR